MFTPRALASCATKQRKRIVLIGDSVMREQATSMKRLISDNNTWTVVFVPFFNGVTAPGMLGRLRKIAIAERVECQRQHSLVVFNAGAHDAYTRMYGRVHFPLQYKTLSEFSVSAYATAMSQARDILETMGAHQLVFRTTTALWLKYGTSYDFNHRQPKDKGLTIHQQRFGEGHNVARAMNEAVAPLFHLTNWSIVDGYAPTLSRPDGQADPLHPGPSLLAPMNAQILELVFWQLCHTTWREMNSVAGTSVA
tara:strand:+ start:895 stop:1650 length:756 start_codon:yes stop_codon:yes gene_type:complete